MWLLVPESCQYDDKKLHLYTAQV